ncbi:hypothetical protein GCM10017576_09470 [Microbacterium barkeri]|uniref:Uncharacterized protein n=1 Tax=Microbacterium barkeri TaxID=33917 RepID=A0A9W6H2C9_9MICO|nr:hypothetical protein GCM10017576_09470 [Microbacterium barkeri]
MALFHVERLTILTTRPLLRTYAPRDGMGRYSSRDTRWPRPRSARSAMFHVKRDISGFSAEWCARAGERRYARVHCAGRDANAFRSS